MKAKEQYKPKPKRAQTASTTGSFGSTWEAATPWQSAIALLFSNYTYGIDSVNERAQNKLGAHEIPDEIATQSPALYEATLTQTQATCTLIRSLTS